MKRIARFQSSPDTLLLSCFVALPLLLLTLHAPAQDTVTIPKSRLEELERKEAELQRMRTVATNAPAPQAAVAPAAPALAPGVPPPPPARAVPAIASLPPLQKDAVVDSVELAGQFRADPVAADKYYSGKDLAVRGVIVAFEKPMFRKNYRILLEGPDRLTSVVCDLLAPDTFKAVFPIEHGTKLVGETERTRQVLAHVGQKVLVRGRCRGWKGTSVLLAADSLQQDAAK